MIAMIAWTSAGLFAGMIGYLLVLNLFPNTFRRHISSEFCQTFLRYLAPAGKVR